MTRQLIASLLGVLTATSTALIMLAGSDLPPPIGFAWLAVVAIFLGILVFTGVTTVLDFGDRAGTPLALIVAVGAGLLVGLVIGLIFILRGSGEPSVPTPDLLDSMLFVGVVGVVGAFGALGLFTVALLADRATTGRSAFAIIVIPGVLVLAIPSMAIATRVVA